jgi:hypothetical protein
MNRAGTRPRPAAGKTARPAGRADGEPRAVANDNRAPLSIRIAKTVAVVAVVALAALAALTI